jgi:phosphoribosylaminoimidazolecarboxamide formyltransferase / IMP cyclohydrolase
VCGHTVINDWTLKYGLNPHQGDAAAVFPGGHEWLEVLNGQVGYVNLLDALRAWTLARELAATLDRPSATSVKHVHPAGAAISGTIDEAFRVAHRLGDRDLSPIATAYARARAGDRIAAFGDFIGLSEPADESCAHLIGREVSDGIIAPSYTPEALEILRKKKKGRYIILRADPSYMAEELEVRRENGLELRQRPNRSEISADLFQRVVSGSAQLAEHVLTDLRLATIVAKHTPSNAVCLAYRGQAIGIGGGQQARIHATRSACEKADMWRLQLHPRAAELAGQPGVGRPAQFNLVRQWLLWNELSERERVQLRAGAATFPEPLTGAERNDWLASFPSVVMSSDGFIPFADNIDRAERSGVSVVAQPGGSAQDDAVTAAANDASITMIHTGLRLFWH